MYNDGGSPTVTNCSFIGNMALSAAGLGGGMWNNQGSPTLTNCTFTGNTANDEGGGMFTSVNSFPTVTNCILWNNGPDEIVGPATVAHGDVQGGFPGTGNIDADPLFVDPDTGDYRLSAGSPCLDAADNTAVPAEITTDLDGNPRFVDDPDTKDTGLGQCPVDMGAYEFQQGDACAPCPWDCGDGDGNIGNVEFLALLAQWGAPGSCDFDGGGVGITDFLKLLAAWGPCP
jgi:hypothetical protein